MHEVDQDPFANCYEKILDVYETHLVHHKMFAVTLQ